ncbi:hypothetical protein AMTRI_Chr12g242140 [Amborella trichopoda]
MNIAFLGKWWQCFASYPLLLWRQILGQKYGTNRLGWFPLRRPNYLSSGIYKSIYASNKLFLASIRYNIKIGGKIFFFFDPWTGHETLNYPGRSSLEL